MKTLTYDIKTQRYLFIQQLTGTNGVALEGDHAGFLKAAKLAHFGPLVSRLLFAVHARILHTGNLTVDMQDAWLADMLWGAQCPRPRNWRPLLARAVNSAAVLQTAGGNGEQWQVSPWLVQVVKLAEGYRITAHPGFLGALGTMVSEDGTLALVARRADPDGKITNDEVDRLRQQDPGPQRRTQQQYRAQIRAKRQSESALPSLQMIGHRGRLWNLFLPAVLGDPAVCKELGLLAALLVREQTRAKPIQGGLVPAWSGRGPVICPLLDSAKTYVAFAANGPNRQGRGYLLRTWAERLDTDVPGLLDCLAAGAQRMGLIVAGLDAEGTWYDLEKIQAAPADVRNRLNVRIYTAADFISRWCRLFAWPGLNGRTEAAGIPRDSEIADLAALVRERGVRAVARALSMPHAVLSLVINGKRRPSPEKVASIRRYLRGTPDLGGKGAGTIFSGCTTMLDYALAYRKLGWAVIPMRPPTSPRKIPRVKYKKFRACLPSPQQIREWWTRWPDAGIGLILGPVSGIFAIDIDGKEAYHALIAKLGTEPLAPTVMSGSGDLYRKHLYFRHPEISTRAKKTPWHDKLEFCGTMGLLVVPPSPHKSGNKYRWAEGRSIEELALPEVPAEVLAELQSEATKHQRASDGTSCTSGTTLGTTIFSGMRMFRKTAEFLQGKFAADEGTRNSRLYAAACDLESRGVPMEAATPLLLNGIRLDDNAHEAECLASIDSAYSKSRHLGRP